MNKLISTKQFKLYAKKSALKQAKKHKMNKRQTREFLLLCSYYVGIKL